MDWTELRRFVDVVAAAFPDAPEPSSFEDGPGSYFLWRRDDREASVGLCEEGYYCALDGCTEWAPSAESAVTALKAVFEDRIVAVRAYDNRMCVHAGMAYASDPGAELHLLGADVRHVTVRSWSRALDSGEEPVFDGAEPEPFEDIPEWARDDT